MVLNNVIFCIWFSGLRVFIFLGTEYGPRKSVSLGIMMHKKRKSSFSHSLMSKYFDALIGALGVLLNYCFRIKGHNWKEVTE